MTRDRSTLLAALADASAHVRAAAARALGDAGDISAVSDLRRVAASDASATVALWAALTASRLDGPIYPDATWKNARDAALDAPRSLEGARYWVPRLAADLSVLELRDLAAEAFRAVGPNAEEALVEHGLGVSWLFLPYEYLGPDRIASAILSYAEKHASEATRCFMLLASNLHPAYEAALTRVARDLGSHLDRAMALYILATDRTPEAVSIHGLLEELVGDDNDRVAATARRLLRERGLHVPLRHPAKTSSGSTRPYVSDGPIPLTDGLPATGTPTVLSAVARVLGLPNEVVGPETVTEDLATDRPYAKRQVRTSRWRCADLAATMVADAEWHDKEGGGESHTLTVDFPSGASVEVKLGVDTYTVTGSGEAARRAAFAFRRGLADLGWEPPPGLPWREGWVFPSATEPTVRYEALDRCWEAILPAADGECFFLDACAEVVGDMLLVWTSCEEGRGGPKPRLFRLHRVSDTGSVLWSIDVDLLPNSHSVELHGGRLRVLSSWTRSLEDAEAIPSVRVIDPETGGSL